MGRATLIDETVLAIEVVIDIARLGPIKGADLALRQGLHPRHLEGLLQRLARNGIVVGERVRGGGYDLARNATLITACDVVWAAISDALTSATRMGLRPSGNCSSKLKSKFSRCFML